LLATLAHVLSCVSSTVLGSWTEVWVWLELNIKQPKEILGRGWNPKAIYKDLDADLCHGTKFNTILCTEVNYRPNILPFLRLAFYIAEIR
jgi:hypothetical protein